MAVNRETPPKSTPLELAFIQLSRQWAALSESLLKGYLIDKEDILLAQINDMAPKVIEALKTVIDSIKGDCKDLDFVYFLSTTGIAHLYALVDWEYKPPDRNVETIFECLIKHERQDVRFKNYIRMLAWAYLLLDLLCVEVIQLLNLQRCGGTTRDDVWKTIAEHKYYMGELDGLMSGVDGAVVQADIDEAVKAIKINMSRSGADAKHKRSREEIAFIKGCWDDWQKDLNKYKNQTKFCEDMLDKVESYTSHDVLMDYCRQWKRQQ